MEEDKKNKDKPEEKIPLTTLQRWDKIMDIKTKDKKTTPDSQTIKPDHTPPNPSASNGLKGPAASR